MILISLDLSKPLMAPYVRLKGSQEVEVSAGSSVWVYKQRGWT